MKLTERRKLCQHCAKNRATWSLTWRWDDEVDGVDISTEDWCDECFPGATDVETAVRIWPDDAGSPETCRA